MNKNRPFRFISELVFTSTWIARIAPLAMVIGSLVAFFLFALDWVTSFRFQHPWTILLLPFIGLAIVWSYKQLGKNAGQGNNLLIEEVHQPAQGIPLRMAPMVLLATLFTHLGGGSAGREGTAVQMGGSIAARWGRWINLSAKDTQYMLLCGISGGFAAVFGTPIAGTVFAIEMVALGTIQYSALLPCLISAVCAHYVCLWWGVHHTQYLVSYTVEYSYTMLVKVFILGALCGGVSRLFSLSIHWVQDYTQKWISNPYLIVFIGGLLLIVSFYVFDLGDYLGLGVNGRYADSITLTTAMKPNGCLPYSWLIKLILTAITLGVGFKGGEVTPLFFIGATLGNTLSVCLNMPVDIAASLGFIAVFAGATNTPLACVLMGIELFGGHYVLYAAIACVTAYFFSGHSGIYRAQLLKGSKTNNT